MIRRAGLGLALAGAVACAGHPPPTPRPKPAPDTAAARPAIPSPMPLPPAPPPPKPARLRLAMVGDINLGTSTLPDGVPPDSGRGLFDAARPALTGDLVVGNFEGVLADTGTSDKCERLRATERPVRPMRRKRARRPVVDTATVRPGCYAFRTPTALAPRLAEAGFTHLNLANNHANDFGPAGRETTEHILDSLGIRLYGPLGRIAIDTVRRGDSLGTVGLIGFATYPFAYDLLDSARSAQVVDSVRPLVDLLIVTFHGGAEGVRALRVPETAESLGREPRGDLRRWARAVIDAGADAVIGHGPHVLRGIEFYRGRPIVYSLGNFLTYRGFNLDGPLGITGVLQLEFAPDRRLLRARLMPMAQHPRAGPEPDSSAAALDLVRRLSIEDFGASAAHIDPGGVITPPP
ncbi:MAG TPA: CapA family protein [Gemmatimonadales bacterium]|nr:CapA family protein [Gemmatimonadales bacterium]